jgi:hypothetical protein
MVFSNHVNPDFRRVPVGVRDFTNASMPPKACAMPCATDRETRSEFGR